jgi:hypothetical protein
MHKTITAVANRLTIGIVFEYVKLKKRSINKINSGSRTPIVAESITGVTNDSDFSPSKIQSNFYSIKSINFLFTFL